MVEVGQGMGGFPPGHGRFGLVGEVLELRPQAHVHPRDLRRLGFPFGDEVRLGQQGLEPVEDRSVQRQERVVGEFDLLRPARQRLVELDEGDGTAVDGDLEAEVEPVVLLRLHRGDLDVRFPAELPVGLPLPASDDLDVLDLLEPGQDVDDEVGGVGVVEFDIGDAVQGRTGLVGLGQQLLDLGDDRVLMLEVAQLGIVRRRGGRELSSVDDRIGPAGCRILPVPGHVEPVAGAEGEEDDEAGLPVGREGHGVIGADDLGAGAQLGIVLLEELLGLGVGDGDRSGRLEHGQRGFLRRRFGRGQSDREPRVDVDAEESVRPDGFDETGRKLRSSIVARSWTRSWPRRRRMSMAAFARCPMRTSMPGLMPTNSMPRLVPSSRWSHSRGVWKSPRWYGAPSGVKSVFPRVRRPASWVNHSWWRRSMSYWRAIRSMVRQVSDFFTQLPDSLSMSGRIASDGFAPGVTASRSSSTVCWASNQVRGMTSTSSNPKATGVCERGASSARGAKASRQSAGMAARVSDTLPSSHLR
jgi:hypothetical protein